MKSGFVYILSNKRRTVLYIGVTAHLKQRIKAHRYKHGSVFTRKYNLCELMYYESFFSIKDAITREKQLKKWNRCWKWELIDTINPERRDLFVDL
ncbi:MAG: endonuclease [Bacteroidetes bacterium MedPE-SWsnd-G2]|nr:MAG: endonuclease [Bacteroidetes bacterium MedPE-SWsnd-G2]